MGIIVRQSIKTTLVIFFGALLGALTNYVYALVFTKPQLGFVTFFVYQAAFIQAIALMGTSALMQVYIQKYTDEPLKQKALVSFSSLVTLFACIIFTIGYYWFKDFIISHYQDQDRANLEKYYWLTPFTVVCWAFMTLFDHYLMSQHKVAISAFMREVMVRLLTIVFLILFVLGLIDFNQFVALIVATYLVPAVILLWISLRIRGFGFTLNFNAFNRQTYREIIHFCWYHLLLMASIYIIGYIDILMLAPLNKGGVATLAVYRIALFIISIMIIPYRAIATASFAVLNRTYIEESTDKLRILFDRLGNNILIVAVCMFCLIACNLDNVVAIFPAGYEDIKPIVFILMIGRIIDMATGMNNEFISISKYYKFNFRISILLVIISFVFMRYSIPKYGIYGAAWSSTFALAVFNILKMIFLWVKMGLQPINKKSALIIIAGAISYGLALLIPYCLNPVVDTIIRSSVVAASYLIILLLTGASPDLKDYLASVKANRRLF
ncbi:MAG: hypothetical protein EOP51_01600 [Sphingobacteriales bacterium]|nr:MAG: hypothetical protein EOP51_01600 [Sphingobacteriales bacterium]